MTGTLLGFASLCTVVRVVLLCGHVSLELITLPFVVTWFLAMVTNHFLPLVIAAGVQY